MAAILQCHSRDECDFHNSYQNNLLSRLTFALYLLSRENRLQSFNSGEEKNIFWLPMQI